MHKTQIYLYPNHLLLVSKFVKSRVLMKLLLFQNIVAMGAGFIDGMKYGDNTKAAVIRLGLMEMIEFSKQFFPGKFCQENSQRMFYLAMSSISSAV